MDLERGVSPRGALVYAAAEVNTLMEELNDAFDDSETQGVPSRVQKKMKAVPHGFFSLRSAWESMRTRDYKLLPLLSEPVQLGTGGKRRENGRWWLTPNANKVAAQLAKAASRSRMKTLVFSHKVDWTVSIAKDINSKDPKHTALLPAELTLVERIVDELGTQTGMYIKLEGDEVVGDAIPHHGLLLADERRLHEKLYQRVDGVPVLVATSTVTQGMNFPSEFVLITSDRRFDPETNSRTRVESHELLNAAGRAGRAGSHSNALVLVIPGEIIEHDGEYRVGKAWKPLQETFSSSDQCVEITDPLLPLLDSMDDNEEWSPLLSYLVRRLDSVTDSEIGPGLLRSSLSAHRKRAEKQDAWMDRRIAHLMEAMETESAEPWARQSSLVSGLPLKDIQFVATHLDSARDTLQGVEEWSDWMLNILAERPALAEEALRSGSRAALGGNHDELDEWSSSGSRFIEHLRVLLPPWLRGSTLQDIQRIGIDRGLAKKSDIMLTFARKFVLRVVPDLAYLFSLPGLIEGQRELLENFVPLPAEHPLFDLGKCVELGVNSGAKVELLQSNPRLTRQSFGPFA